jgi:hypothetical protein
MAPGGGEMAPAVDDGSPVDPEEGGGTEPVDSAHALRHALEAVLLWFLGVGYNIAAINYVFSPSPALGAALRVAGTLHVDATVLFFLLQGLDAAAEPPTDRWAHVRTAFPGPLPLGRRAPRAASGHVPRVRLGTGPTRPSVRSF